MKINDIYSYDKSNISENFRVNDAGSAAAGIVAGDILEGIVTSVDGSATVSFEKLNNREISFSKSDVKHAYVGQKRSFEVVEANADRLVLRDLGETGAEIAAKGVISAKVDMGMPKMVDDFEKTNGTKEEEDIDSIQRLSDGDYSELAAEGFSIEDYKAERLVRALARIKAQRAAGRENLDNRAEKIKEEREAVKKQAAKAAADKYASYGNIVEALEAADLPLTDDNIASIAAAISMSSAAVHMTDNSYAYMIGNGLEPTVDNIYRAVYSGSIKRGPINPEDWKSIRPAAEKIVNEADEMIAEAEYGDERLEPADMEDAGWLVEYDLPLSKENLVYKKELEELKADGRDADKVARAAAKAMEQGAEAKDAVLIRSHAGRRGEDGTGDSGQEGNGRQDAPEALTAKLRLQEIRLSMAIASDSRIGKSGEVTDIGGIQEQIDALKAEIKSFYSKLAVEIGANDDAAELAADTALALENVAEAPVTLYGITFASRYTITLGELSDAAAKPDGTENIGPAIAPRAAMSGAIGSYEASATEIRKDLGDSIRKAFGNVDALLEDAGMELTEMNRRAVRILGYNSMEITAENIENIKYYDARVTAMLEGMKPAVVMSMIKRGYNPLEQNIDTLNREIREILDEEGVSDEEKFSTFLVKLEAANDIPEATRDAYIGIYRLLYQIEKTDGAVLGAAINSGRQLTLKNLLTEARTRTGKGVDALAADDVPFTASFYTNSISEQIDKAFEGIQHERFEYNMSLTEQISDITDSRIWKSAGEPDELEELTPEQLFERLNIANAEKSDNTVSEAAARVRTVMASQTSTRKFLKSLGIVDSVRNTEILDEDDISLGFADVKELVGAMEQPDELADRYLEAQAAAERRLQDSLLGDRTVMSGTSALTAVLGRYRLLSEMARREHYRMSVEGDSPARINLTLIHSGKDEGKLSLEIGTAQYHVRAELSITSYGPEKNGGRIDGTVNCDGADELVRIAEPMAVFAEVMKRSGFDTEGITKRIDRISPDMYLGRLADAVQNTGNERYRIGTARIYAIAKEFISSFFGE